MVATFRNRLNKFINKGVRELKKPVEYKIDDEVLVAFNKLANENVLNKSQWIGNKIKEYLKEAKENDKLFYITQLETKNDAIFLISELTYETKNVSDSVNETTNLNETPIETTNVNDSVKETPTETCSQQSKPSELNTVNDSIIERQNQIVA